MRTPEGINVTIMGKSFLVACPAEERDALINASFYLDKKMREIQNTGKVIGIERCAIIAALNIAHELLQMQQNAGQGGDLQEKLRLLHDKIEAVLPSH